MSCHKFLDACKKKFVYKLNASLLKKLFNTLSFFEHFDLIFSLNIFITTIK